MEVEARLIQLASLISDLKDFVKDDTKLSKLVTFNVLTSWDLLRGNPSVQTIKQLQTNAAISKFINSFVESQAVAVLLQQQPERVAEEVYDKKALFVCAQRGTVKEFEALLAQSPKDVLTKLEDVDGAFLLHHAAKGGNLALIKYMLGSGVPVDLQSKQHKVARLTPLMEAVKLNQLEAVKILLTYDAQLSSKFRSSEEKTAMDYASDAMKLEIRTHKLALRAGKIRVDPLPRPQPAALPPTALAPRGSRASYSAPQANHPQQQRGHPLQQNPMMAPHQVIGPHGLPPFQAPQTQMQYQQMQYQHHIMQLQQMQQQQQQQQQTQQQIPPANLTKAKALGTLQANLDKMKGPSSNGGVAPRVTSAAKIRSGEAHELHAYQSVPPDGMLRQSQHPLPPAHGLHHGHHPHSHAQGHPYSNGQQKAPPMAPYAAPSDRSGLPSGLEVPAAASSSSAIPAGLPEFIAFDGSADMFAEHPEYQNLNASELAHELWNTVDALREELDALKAAQSQPADKPPAPSHGECIVCFDNEICMVMIPCGHFILCQQCASLEEQTKCIFCRAPVKECLRVYFGGVD
mgnify:CR=1 FL=1